MPSPRYLAYLGRMPAPKVTPTKRFPDAVPHILIPRCQAEVDGRQCKNEATKPSTRQALVSEPAFCGQHYKGLPL